MSDVLIFQNLVDLLGNSPIMFVVYFCWKADSRLKSIEENLVRMIVKMDREYDRHVVRIAERVTE